MTSLARSAYLIKHAPPVFSRMFKQLLLACFISKEELSRRSVALRDTLQDGGSLGSMARPTIVYVINNQQRVSQIQLLVWFGALKQWCDDDPVMLATIDKIDPPVRKPRFPDEIEGDFYRLALFGSPDEIDKAYERWKDYSLFDYLYSTMEYGDTGEIPAYRPEASICSRATS